MQTLPDPRFDPAAVTSRVENLWFQVLTAHLTGDPEPLKPYFSPSLYRLLEAAVAGETRYAPLRPAVLQCRILSCDTVGGRQQLECALFTRVVPAEQGDGKALSPRMDGEVFCHETWTLTRPAGAVTPEKGKPFPTHCEGCGAPLSLYKSAKCPFCGKLVRVPDFDWTVLCIQGAKDSLRL